MINKICLITNYNLYESKRCFTEGLSAALNRLNVETKIIDVRENALGAAEISSIVRFGPQITCSFNSLLAMSDNRFVWDFLEIPHLSILVDPALYSINLTNSPYSILSSVDRFDCENLRSNGFQNVFFWPHAVESNVALDEKEDRPIDVVFLGSCYDYETLRATWKETLSKEQCLVLEDAVDIVLSEVGTSLAAALVKAWNASKLVPQGVDFMTLFYFLDYYTRGKDRVDLINSIRDAHVHVFGELARDIAGSLMGWPQYLSGHPHATIHPPVNFSGIFDILKKSKICLNSMPFFKNGSHERVFTSLMCGALPLTTDNLYFQEIFGPQKDVLFYRSNHLDQVNEMVNACLRDEKKRRQTAHRGREIVMKEHTWDRRAEQLLAELPGILERIASDTMRKTLSKD